MSQQQNTENTDFDNPWKVVIELYFREFLLFFFPWIEAEIDWDKPIQFLDKELQKIVRDANTPKNYADKLIQVHRKDGQKALVIIHAEVQSQEENIFPSRMYTYNYRLRDRYNCPVVSLAILGDDSKTWRPDHYSDSLWGCSTRFEFPIVKLTDYAQDWAALEADMNPFAVVVMAHLKAKETRHQLNERKDWKFHLITMLHNRGYREQDILELYNFLDYLFNLPEDLEQQLQIELTAFEEAKQMKYITSIERMGEARGEAKGAQSKAIAIALNMLNDSLPLEQISRFTGLTIEEIQQLQANKQ
jgi:predicted transposase YdaD